LSFGRTDAEQRALRDGSIVLVDRDAGAMAWLTDFVQEMSTDDAARAVRTGLLPDGSSFEPEHMALLEKPLALPLETRPVEPGTVRRMTTQSGTVAFDVNAASASVLFVSQSFHPGWKATVNGADAEVLRANGAFQGVVVPAGFSHVDLRFDPASLKVGGLISLAALLGLALLPAIEQRVRRRLA
jgi:cell division septation protein DedD